MTRVLFIPHVAAENTSERSSELYHLLCTSEDVVGLRAPFDQLIYDTARAKWPRYALYPLDKGYLSLSGMSLARRHRAEIVFCETAHHALPGLWIARMLGIPCLWDSHGSMRIYARSMRRGFFFTGLTSLLERFLARRVDALICVSEEDVEVFKEMGVQQGRSHVIPTCVNFARIDALKVESDKVRKHDNGHPGTPVLLFFGSFRYPPNAEALVYINDTLAPFLEAQGAECRIWIAGRNIPALNFHRFIRPLGFVENIYAYIRAADLSIVPLWRGTGLKSVVLTKVLDAMAVGTASAMTSFAARGIPGLEDGVHAFVASTPEEFPRIVLEAIRDPAARKQVAQNGRRLIESRYNWEDQRPRLKRILREMADARRT